MRQYHICALFDSDGTFDPDEISYHILKGRKNFLIFLRWNVTNDEVFRAADFLAEHKVNICIHDNTFLIEENDISIGRNLQKIFILLDKGVNVEGLSYHLGSIYGFGRNISQLLIEDHIRLRLNEKSEGERFMCAGYPIFMYLDGRKMLFEYLANISDFAEKYNLKVLIKNLCLDYLLVTDYHKEYFMNMGYTNVEHYHRYSEEDLGYIPKLLEKGEFPRTAKEMKHIAETFNVKLALDLEHLLFQTLLSQKFNIHNDEFMRRWDITLTDEDEESLEDHGFMIRPGVPLIYERPLDLVDEIVSLRDHIFIAHLSGSVGPVFLDKENLTREDITLDVLLGIVDEKDIPHTRRGKAQLSSLGGIIDAKYDAEFEHEDRTQIAYTKLFEHDASLAVWKEMFMETFTNQVVCLKEIGVDRVVQKMRRYNEKATSTFEIFSFLVDKFLT